MFQTELLHQFTCQYHKAMWKFATLLVIAIFSSASAQEPIALNCTFDYNKFLDEYVCSLSEIEVLDPTQDVIIAGEHVGNRTNDDVKRVQIRNSNTPFMIQQFFTTFRNMINLEITSSHLESINIPDSIRLQRLYVSGNNISHIANGTFSAQSQLLIFYAINSEVQVIEEDAFVGLESLTALDLSGNNITRIVNGTFSPLTQLRTLSAIRAGVHVIEEDAFVGLKSLSILKLMFNNISEISTRILSPLINAEMIDFERNNLTRIDDIFSSNTKLRNLYLEYNQINEISPRFIANLRNSLLTVNLVGNRCVDRFFFVEDENELIIFNNVLRPCFANFNGNVSETRRITLEFQGPLALFDEFGNIIARVN